MSINNKISDKELVNPFPGLRPFSIEESHLFFGREGQSEEVLYNLSKNRFVAVVGSSGSGKSSLMYCGLVPILHGGFITEAGAKWKVIVTRPGNDPIGNLAEAVANYDKKTDSDYNKNIVRSVLESSSLGLIEAIKQIDREEDENILILADQFEELFRFKKKFDNTNSANESFAFVKLLLEAVKQTEVPIYIVMTMRSDFIGECSQYQELTQFINNSHYLVPQMTRDNLRAAIEGPVAVGGGKISDKLVNQLLNDVGDNPDQLPILQHALMRTWDYWISNKKTEEEMDIIHYEAIGCIETALSKHANEAYDELDPEEKRICENLFKTLTERGSDNRGIRHPSGVHEIAAISMAKEIKVISVIERFRSKGRSFLTSSDTELTKDSIIDISHESMMRIWDKLKVWVDEESIAVQMYVRLSEAASAYQDGKIGLWRPPDLHLAVNWRKEKQPTLTWAKRYAPAFERTMAYLETSEKEHVAEEQNKIRLQKKALRRSRIFAIVLGTAAIISLGFMVYAIIMQQESNKQRQEAEKQTKIALTREKEAQLQKEEAEKQRKRAEHQHQIANTKQKEAIEQQMEAEKQKTIALESLEEARLQREIAFRKSTEANEQRKLAEVKSKEALEEKNKAENAREDAYKLRMLSIAQSMAVKSVQITDNAERKALLAYQAYFFNRDYNGSEYNPDVYSGLYYSLKSACGLDFNVYSGHNNAVKAIAFTPNSKVFYTSGSDGKILKWDLSDTTKSYKLIHSENTIFQDISQSPNLKWLACASESKEILVVDLNTGNKNKLIGHTGYVTSVDFSNDSEFLVSGGADSTVLKWNNNSSEKTHVGYCNSAVKSVAISPDDKLIAAASTNGEIVLWDSKTLKKQILFTGTETINVVTFSKDGKSIAAGDKLGNIYIWSTSDKGLIAKYKGHNARVNDMQFSSDSKLLASASSDNTTKIWQTKNLNIEPIVLKDHDAWVLALSFSSDAKELVTACSNSVIKSWEIQSKFMAKRLLGKMTRNMSQNEWNTYVGEDIPYKKSLDQKP
jgi:WD40 repeat protein/energy-coupling factor transporter ATP-binding protein EcfA2